MSEEKKDDHAEGGIETYKFIVGGIMVIVLFMVIFGLKSYYKTKKSEDKNPTNTEQGTKGNNETSAFTFSTSGKNVYATRDNPAKAGLCPLTSTTSQVNDDPSRTSRARYVLASDATKYFDSPGLNSEWHKMPTGDYLIYPIDPQDEGIGFSWSLNQ